MMFVVENIWKNHIYLCYSDIYRKKIIMKTRITEKDITRIVKRTIMEQEFPLEKTVMDAGAFEEGEIPAECTGENVAGMSQVDMISACLGKVTEKSTTLNNTIKALNDLLNKTKSEADSLTTESRRQRRRI